MMPPRRILAAVDFSPSSRSALTVAAALARRTGADLQLLHAVDPDVADAAAGVHLDIVADARRELARFTERAGCDGIDVTALHVAIGTATDVICDISSRENADLLVMGVRGHSSRRTQCGTTATGVVRHAAVPTMFVPQVSAPRRGGDEQPHVGRVIVALDLTGPALCAAAAAIPFATALGATLDAVCVVPPLRTAPRWKAHGEAATKQRLRRALREVALRVRGLSASSPLHWRAAVGDVAAVLTDTTRPSDGHLSVLVMGRRMPGHRDFDPGTLATRVLAPTHGPVLLYPSAGD